jgi:hypothetical protein
MKKRYSIKNKKRYSGRYSKKYGKRGGDLLKPSTWRPSTWFSSSAWKSQQPVQIPKEQQQQEYVSINQPNLITTQEVSNVRNTLNKIFTDDNKSSDVCKILRSDLNSMERSRLFEIVEKLNIPKNWKDDIKDLNIGCTTIDEDQNAVKVKERYNKIIDKLNRENELLNKEIEKKNKNLEDAHWEIDKYEKESKRYKNELNALEESGNLVRGNVILPEPVEGEIISPLSMNEEEENEIQEELSKRNPNYYPEGGRRRRRTIKMRKTRRKKYSKKKH